MAIHIYNTVSRKKEVFVPRSGNDVGMFVCGQTVYDESHLGHAKTYINFDVVVRWLRHRSYKVKYLQNITDVDDKIIKRAAEEGVEPISLARRYEGLFLEDMGHIGVRNNVTEYPRSHDYIPQMRDQVQLLVDRGYAYELDGDVYFDVAKFKDYTKLSNIKLDELENHRIEPKEGKRNVYDFALWKAAKAAGEPQWEITLNIKGKEVRLLGRPGWHLEDTAIAHHFFGPQYDIHGGAKELIFPHHTNEIAQAEAAYGIKPYVRYWMHCGVLNIKGVKMSKSLRNFIKIRDVLKKYHPEALRLMVCASHYRSEIEYEEKMIVEASKRLAFLRSSVSSVYNMKEAGEVGEKDEISSDALLGKFEEAMDDDFNTPLALASLYEAAAQMKAFADSHEAIPKQLKDGLVTRFVEMARTLGLLEDDSYKKGVPEEARRLILERERLRKEKNFTDSDKIRLKLKEVYDVTVEDTEYGTVWYR
jgi:cysteinyl-tRNA synthetase